MLKNQASSTTQDSGHWGRIWEVGNVRSTEEFSRSDARRYAKVSAKELREWEQGGLYESLARFDWGAINELQRIKWLSRQLPRRGRRDRLRILLKVVRRFGGRRALRELKFFLDGRKVIAAGSGLGPFVADTGQLLLEFGAIPITPVGNIVQLDPTPQQDKVRQAEYWFQSGLDIEEEGGSPEEAHSAYQKSIELNPDAAGAWVNLGTMRYRDGDLGEAEKSYRKAIEVSPGYALAHFNMGNICEETNRLREAAGFYEQSIRLQQNYADAHYNLALVYERLGEPMRAAKHWRAYLKIDPTSPWSGIARQQLRGLVQVTPGGVRNKAIGPRAL